MNSSPLLPDHIGEYIKTHILPGDVTVKAAAEVLGVAEGTVKSRCSRGRAALAPLLAHRDPARREPEVP